MPLKYLFLLLKQIMKLPKLRELSYVLLKTLILVYLNFIYFHNLLLNV